jgi:uncharacterized alkaline shock family protein YloU
MPTKPDPARGTAANVHVADGVLAKIAAYRTLQVPGVAMLRPSLARTVSQLPGRVIRDRPVDSAVISTDGVRVDRSGHQVVVELDVVLYYGQSCLDVANAIQEHVSAALNDDCGVKATVTVNIVDLELAADEPPALGIDQTPI